MRIKILVHKEQTYFFKFSARNIGIYCLHKHFYAITGANS